MPIAELQNMQRKNGFYFAIIIYDYVIIDFIYTADITNGITHSDKRYILTTKE